MEVPEIKHGSLTGPYFVTTPYTLVASNTAITVNDVSQKQEIPTWYTYDSIFGATMNNYCPIESKVVSNSALSYDEGDKNWI